jgi:hypothetical protein
VRIASDPSGAFQTLRERERDMEMWIEWNKKVRARLEHCLGRHDAPTAEPKDIRAALTRIRELEIAIDNVRAAVWEL